MAITEQSRKQLYERLEEVLGEERATTLMEHLPPVGWADVATKHDVEHVRMFLSAELAHTREVTERRFVEVDRRLDSLGEIFATKHELAQIRGDMFKLVAAQTVALVIAMSTIVPRLAG